MTQIQENKLPEGWIETTLGELIKIGRGSSPRPIQNFIVEKNGIPWVKIADATASSNRYIESTKEFIKEEGRSTTVLYGDLIVSNSATPGIPKFMRIEACVHDGWLVFSEYKNLDKLYLYYFFLDYRIRLEHSAFGTVFKNLTTEIVRNVPISLPPLPEQQAIAKVLSSFDDKIELLREQNETLEKIGQELFKEWFGKYKLGDELPKGWRVGKLSDFGNIICGKTPSKDNKDFFGGDIPFIKIPDMHNEVYISETVDTLTELGANTQKNKFIPENSICVSCIATVGLVGITTKFSQTNQQINSIIPFESFYLEYLYFVLTNMKNDLIAMGGGGSATLNINTTSFSNIEINIPDIDLLKSFHEKVQNMFEKIKINSEEIETLSKTRDELLPKLMKGEVRVV
ncbi:MAG: restriction endonuclease subunit S [Candidatus Altimarinota bacterium]